MKFPEFDHNRAKYDRFQTRANYHLRTHLWMHETEALLVTTEQGIAFMQKHDVKPDRRMFYADQNISIIKTGDEKQPKYLSPDGEPVPTAWLNGGGQQLLVIDYDHNIVVRCDYVRDLSLPEFTPEWIENVASCWWPGPHKRPYGRPIRIERPYVPTKEELEHVNEIKKACDMWYQLNIVAEGKHRKHLTPEKALFTVLVPLSFDMIHNDMRERIAVRGIERGTVVSHVEHLKIAEPET